LVEQGRDVRYNTPRKAVNGTYLGILNLPLTPR